MHNQHELRWFLHIYFSYAVKQEGKNNILMIKENCFKENLKYGSVKNIEIYKHFLNFQCL